MASFDVKVTVTENRFGQYSRLAHQRSARAVRRAAFATHRFSKPFTPVDTGDLTTRMRIEFSNGGLSGTVRWLMPYGIYQHEGTRRGVTAKKFAEKGALRANPVFESDVRKAWGGALS